jgi:hypothetical protein
MMPKPLMPVSLLPSARAMPTPRASTSGAVTVPVVMPPASQATPIRSRAFLSNEAKSVSATQMARPGKIVTFSDLLRTKRTMPLIDPRPTPAAASSRIRNVRLFRKSQSIGAVSYLTPPPSTVSAATAGSAKVAMVPSRNATNRMTAMPALAGSVAPMFSPSGMTPRRMPSMKNISPSTTAIRPPVMAKAWATPWRRTASWNTKRKAETGSSALNCSMNLALKYGATIAHISLGVILMSYSTCTSAVRSSAMRSPSGVENPVTSSLPGGTELTSGGGRAASLSRSERASVARPGSARSRWRSP